MIDYPESELVKRDIVYFFHLQMDYTHLECNIDWGLFRLSYWKFLQPENLGEHDDLFIQRGCLSMILAGLESHAGNIGNALGSDADLIVCGETLKSIHYADELAERLRVLAVEVFELANQKNHVRDFDAVARIPAKTAWVHREIVIAYYDDIRKSQARFAESTSRRGNS
jgi:hypothetical protein